MSHALAKLRVEARAMIRKLTGEKARARARADAGFEAALATLKAGDLAIDLGANAGIFTEKMAATGADVIAFEPDPHAFETLSKRVGGLKNVRLINAAAAETSGVMKLYRHVNFADAPERHSTGSSLVAGKARTSEAMTVEVEVVDFPAFLLETSRPVALLKVDIEGAEVALIETLLASPAGALVQKMFVETHERVLPQLAARTRALKQQTRGSIAPEINWDWR
ncbi:FkbM family methyltransferase [Lentibacter algarum]|uniref:FkbM family methyltransferase n=1 Tax=Lentibacter algarum TaxID=576131 RepID=UPI001C09CE3A|nr:FkbM family methyltransferase [Lentibacter algarum]MBU2983465.1 FkbM family methyltransferase [Lentibacter algarum]